MQDFQALQIQFAEALPFVRHVGVEIVEIGDGFAIAKLTQTEPLANHLGSLHAGAIFTLGETASGAAMIGAFAPMATSIRPLATAARISYLKLGRGTITAYARTALPGQDLRHQLKMDGLVAFDIEVDLQDDRARPVAHVVVSWRVTLPKSTGDKPPGSSD